MNLSALLSVLPEKKVFGNGGPEITGLVYDPLRATPGCLYVAINIYTQLDKIEIPDGHPVLPEAIRAGAVAVVLQDDLDLARVQVQRRSAFSKSGNRFCVRTRS